MSHQPHDTNTNICPNCGSPTTRNFCAECGQETHLHKETFGGMVMHFIGHYFHYDSKFWQTIKTLLFHPGKLTIAYGLRQRMRYIPPISLYIFVSAVFFLIMWSNPNKMFTAKKGLITLSSDKHRTPDSTLVREEREEEQKGTVPWYRYDPKRDTANLMHFIQVKGDKLDDETGGNSGVYILEHMYHTLPKVFFFLIPLMAFLLQLLFIRRPDAYFTDHAVFSLHIHSFIFTLLILLYIPFVNRIPFLHPAMFLLALAYLSAALHTVYGSGWVRSVCYSLILTLVYILFLCIALVGEFFAILYFI